MSDDGPVQYRLDVPARIDQDREPIHQWFELTYAQYLTIPRSVLQSMPQEWQAMFVTLLEEMDGMFDWRPKQGRYWVTLKDGRGRFVHDPLRDYNRGRRKLSEDGIPFGGYTREHDE